MLVDNKVTHLSRRLQKVHVYPCGMSTGELLYDVHERWLVVYVEPLPHNLFNCIVCSNELLDEVTLLFRKILCRIHDIMP